MFPWKHLNLSFNVEVKERTWLYLPAYLSQEYWFLHVTNCGFSPADGSAKCKKSFQYSKHLWMKSFWPTQQKTEMHPEVKLVLQHKTVSTVSSTAVRKHMTWLHMASTKDTSWQLYTPTMVMRSNSDSAAISKHFFIQMDLPDILKALKWLIKDLL